MDKINIEVSEPKSLIDLYIFFASSTYVRFFVLKLKTIQYFMFGYFIDNTHRIKGGSSVVKDHRNYREKVERKT